MAERKRSANIELLRIIAMAMVVVLHFFEYSGYLPDTEMAVAGEPLNALNYVAIALESLCIVAVNSYILISGYFGGESKWRPSKLFRFLGQIWFYTLLIPVVLYCFGKPVLPETEGVYGIAKYVFPVGTSHFWFVTCYFQLLLLMPILNLAVKAITQKQLTIVLVCLLLTFCGIKTLCPIELVTDKYGYDIIWFICLYLTGAWLRSFGESVLTFMKNKALLIYVGSSVVMGLAIIIFYHVTGLFSGAQYYFSVPWHYNYLFCLTGAIGLFFLFMNLRIKEGQIADLIRKIAKYCFGVYLFHEHLDMNDLWYPFFKGIINPLQQESIVMLFLELFVCLVVLYGAGLCIDFIRTALFAAVSKCMKNTIVVRKMKELDEIFASK